MDRRTRAWPPTRAHRSMTWRSILERYPFDWQSVQAEALGSAGGFSGAQFWRLKTARGNLCLRRWPREHPSAEQLREMHAVLARVWKRGFQRFPPPQSTRDGQTYVEQESHLWELTPWLPGSADYHRRPSQARLSAAACALAESHLA